MDKVRAVVLWLTFILVMGVVNFKVWEKSNWRKTAELFYWS